jgi:leucyl aminopeptidase
VPGHTTQGDLAWRLPLHPGYRKQLDSKTADLSSTGGEGAQGGAILAALYLQEFVKASVNSWMHIDTGGWTVGSSAGPGRPEGGEPLLLRSLVEMLRLRYGKASSS